MVIEEDTNFYLLLLITLCFSMIVGLYPILSVIGLTVFLILLVESVILRGVE